MFAGTYPAASATRNCPAESLTDAPLGSDLDLDRIKCAVREIYQALNHQPDGDGWHATPAGVAGRYRKLFAGMAPDARVDLRHTVRRGRGGEVVIVRGIPFVSLCAEHLLPCAGKAHVGYLPADGREARVSQLERTIGAVARRPQAQQHMTDRIADALAEQLGADAVAVVVDAEHLCLKARGAAAGPASVQTSSIRGRFRKEPSLGAGVISLIA